MAKLTDARVTTLKGHFNQGDQPSEANFADLIQWIQEGIEEHDHAGTGDGDGILFPNLGIGLARTEGTLHVHTATAGVVTADANARDIVIENDGAVGLSFLHPNDGSGKFAWGCPADALLHFIVGYGTTHGTQANKLRFYVNNGYRIDVDSNGYVGINKSAPAGQLHVDQSVSDAAIPALVLDQADTSEGLINFIGSDRGVVAINASVASVRVELNGTVYLLPLYANA